MYLIMTPLGALKSAVLEVSVDPWEDVPKHDLGENPRPQFDQIRRWWVKLTNPIHKQMRKSSNWSEFLPKDQGGAFFCLKPPSRNLSRVLWEFLL